jgi:hypothetical protein
VQRVGPTGGLCLGHRPRLRREFLERINSG